MTFINLLAVFFISLTALPQPSSALNVSIRISNGLQIVCDVRDVLSERPRDFYPSLTLMSPLNGLLFYFNGSTLDVDPRVEELLSEASISPAYKIDVTTTDGGLSHVSLSNNFNVWNSRRLQRISVLSGLYSCAIDGHVAFHQFAIHYAEGLKTYIRDREISENNTVVRLDVGQVIPWRITIDTLTSPELPRVLLNGRDLLSSFKVNHTELPMGNVSGLLYRKWSLEMVSELIVTANMSNRFLVVEVPSSIKNQYKGIFIIVNNNEFSYNPTVTPLSSKVTVYPTGYARMRYEITGLPPIPDISWKLLLYKVIDGVEYLIWDGNRLSPAYFGGKLSAYSYAYGQLTWSLEIVTRGINLYVNIRGGALIDEYAGTYRCKVNIKESTLAYGDIELDVLNKIDVASMKITESASGSLFRKHSDRLPLPPRPPTELVTPVTPVTPQLRVAEGVVLSVECKSYFSAPEASMHVSIDGMEISTAENLTTNKSKNSTGNGFVSVLYNTTIQVSLVVDRRFHGRTLQCAAKLLKDKQIYSWQNDEVQLLVDGMNNSFMHQQNISLISIPERVTKGSSFIIHCNSNQPKIPVYKDGQIFSFNNLLLSDNSPRTSVKAIFSDVSIKNFSVVIAVQGAEAKHSGKYACGSKQGDGKVVTVVTPTANDSPKPMLSLNGSRNVAIQKTSSQLTCSFGETTADVGDVTFQSKLGRTWTLIGPSARHKFGPMKNDGHANYVVMTIEHTRLQDTGSYRCKVGNRASDPFALLVTSTAIVPRYVSSMARLGEIEDGLTGSSEMVGRKIFIQCQMNVMTGADVYVFAEVMGNVSQQQASSASDRKQLDFRFLSAGSVRLSKEVVAVEQTDGARESHVNVVFVPRGKSGDVRRYACLERNLNVTTNLVTIRLTEQQNDVSHPSPKLPPPQLLPRPTSENSGAGSNRKFVGVPVLMAAMLARL